jgi:hypothetical protein
MNPPTFPVLQPSNGIIITNECREGGRPVHQQEFERQISNLISRGYHQLCDLQESEFKEQLEPLRERITLLPEYEGEKSGGHAPFVIVIQNDKLDNYATMQLVERNGKTGFSVMDSEDLQQFQPIGEVELPKGHAYIMVDIDTGKETLNVTPNAALEAITAHQRSPLTIPEGIALVTHFPDLIKKNNGFSLLASRCGDRRVTAIWISEGRPKLGWCWAGNPHTWLGSASCKYRLGCKD